MSALEIPLTERQLFALLLAYNRPVSVDDLASAVLALEPSELFDRLQRLRHGSAAYQLLYRLKRRGLLRQGERAGVAVFGLRRPIRARFTKALDRVFPTLSA